MSNITTYIIYKHRYTHTCIVGVFVLFEVGVTPGSLHETSVLARPALGESLSVAYQRKGAGATQP